MNKLGFILLLSLLGMLTHVSYAQDTMGTTGIAEITPLFDDPRPLAFKLRFAPETLKKNTSDSTYIISALPNRKEDSMWDSLSIKLRPHGHYRLNNCYHVPLEFSEEKGKRIKSIF